MSGEAIRNETTQETDLALGMRDILEYAKHRLPGSILCCISFTTASDDEEMQIEKLATNTMEREELFLQVVDFLDGFRKAPVLDLSGETIQ
jgi:hypothetical protein